VADIDNLSAEDALNRLMDGNARYISGELEHPNTSIARRDSLASGQAPFAVIVTCADSRVVPELMFDQGLGDLFVIRVAGNIVDDAVIGSIEYAVAHLGVNLVMMLGHQSCGAVGAAVAGQPTGDFIDALIAAIAPAVDAVRDSDGDLLDNAIRANAQQSSSQLTERSTTVVGPGVAAGKVNVVPAYYALSDGSVSLVD